MKSNTGTTDRAIRIIVAAAIAVLIGTGKVSGTTAIGLGVAAAVLAVTSLVGFCPLYFPFGISTRKNRTT